MNDCCHTSSLRLAKKMWIHYGGSIAFVRRTGEVFFRHPLFAKPLRVNNRRLDVPGKLMSLLNQIRRYQSAKDRTMLTGSPTL